MGNTTKTDTVALYIEKYMFAIQNTDKGGYAFPIKTASNTIGLPFMSKMNCLVEPIDFVTGAGGKWITVSGSATCAITEKGKMTITTTANINCTLKEEVSTDNYFYFASNSDSSYAQDFVYSNGNLFTCASVWE